MGTGDGELLHRHKLLALCARLVGDMGRMADAAQPVGTDSWIDFEPAPRARAAGQAS
jgi:hypothetical protein